jgi:polyisoprenoid-binding protein YceI
MRGFVTALVLLAVCSSPVFASHVYTVDRSHSVATFSIRHFAETVQGTFTDISGTITYDESDVTKSRVNVSIGMASVDTQASQRDAHLRSSDFFDTAVFPSTVFESQRVEKRAGGYVAIGTLTMHGVTKPIEIPFSLTFSGNDAHGMSIQGTAQLDRREYGVSWNQVVDNKVTLGDEVRVELNLQAMPAR